MPSTARKTIKRDLERAARNISTAQEKVGRTGMLYEKVHPKYYEAFKEIVQDMETAKEKLHLLNTAI